MTVQIRRRVFDFLAQDYRTNNPKVQLLPDGPPLPARRTQLGTKCVMRWYLSMQGEESPAISQMVFSQDAAIKQRIYRYDWAFGITVIKGFWWDWQKDLPTGGALAIHVVLQPIGDAPEAIPISATVSALHPSRNTKGFWELAWPGIPRIAADAAKIVEPVLPPLRYLSSGLALASNVIESQSANQKNWFLYQFLDENLRCPTVEWRINKNVLAEYGPLLRGSLFLAFGSSTGSDHDSVRVLLRPQIRYNSEDDICYIIPTAELPDDQQVYIDVKPREERGVSAKEHNAPDVLSGEVAGSAP